MAITVPGGFEGFFIEASERDLRIPDNMPDFIDLTARHGLLFVGPADWNT